jgi:hypothetical protein
MLGIPVTRRRPGGDRRVQPLLQRHLIAAAFVVVKGLALGRQGGSLLHYRHNCSSSLIGYWDTEVMLRIVPTAVTAHDSGIAPRDWHAKTCEIA